jgi:hypothetical protein
LPSWRREQGEHHLVEEKIDKHSIQHPYQVLIIAEEFYPGEYQEEKEGKGKSYKIMKEQTQQGDPVITGNGGLKPDGVPGNGIQHFVGKFPCIDKLGKVCAYQVGGTYK